MEHSTHTQTAHIGMNNFISFICFSIASASEILSRISGEDIYNFCFGFLSIISISFIIIINWPKVKETIIKSYKKRKNGNNSRKTRKNN